MSTSTVDLPATRRGTRWERPTTVALLLWGLLHIVGGASMMAMAAADPLAALRSLGSAAPSGDFPTDPGPVTQAVVGFHGLNLFFAGLAVTILSVAWSWRRYPRGVPTSLLIATAADVGLVAYLLIPGSMKLTDGVWGPLLLVLAVAGAALARRQAVAAEHT